MSPRKQVPSLYNLTLTNVKHHIFYFLTHHLNYCKLHEQSVRNPINCGYLMAGRKKFMDNLNTNITNDLFNKFGEECYCKQSHVQKCALPFLISSEIKIFSFAIGTMQDAWVTVNPLLILSTLQLYGTHIVKLTIINSFIPPSVFRDAITNMSELEYLKIDGNDELLKIIGEVCEKLVILDISRGIEVTRNGLQNLCYHDYPQNSAACHKCCSTLEVVSLSNEINNNGKLLPRIPEEATVLLETMMNLKSLGVYRYVGEAMTEMIQNSRKFSSRFMFIEETRMYYSRWDLLPLYCENVVQIKLCDSLTQNNLHHLCKFKKCRKVTFQHCYWTHLEQYLQINGSIIQELNLRTVQGSPVINRINLLCPNLEKLSIRARTYKCSMTEAFPKLQCFSITLWKTEDKIPLLYLIKNMPVLKTLCIANCGELNDTDVISLTSIHTFTFLENLLFCNCAKLSLNSLRVVIEHCPRLKYLGDVFRLEKAAVENCKAFYDELQQYNYDLRLVRAEEFKKKFLQTGFGV